MRIVIDDKIPFIRGAFEPYAEVVYLPGGKTGAEDVRDADALITRTRTRCDSSLLKDSRVKVIATATIGFDHIDTQWCESAGIWWTNAPGCNSWSVKQYISSVLVREAQKHSLDLSGMTLGVVGVGNVGSKVAVAARSLGMRVLLNDPPRERKEGSGEFTDLDTLLRESDIVTLHVPLTVGGEDSTYHLFNAARLASMRADQILINSSRGPVVDNAALKACLQRGGLRGAVLDVWEGEPSPDPELVRMLDFGTPHIAGYSADGKANGTAMSIRAVSSKFCLPLSAWSCKEIPAPTHGAHCGEDALDFVLDADGRADSEVLSEAVLHAYDVAVDSDALRSDLSSFEALRGDYPVRREPSAYTVRLKGGSPSLCAALQALDFNVKTIK